MSLFKITINIDPSPKQRVSPASKNGKRWSYTPKKTRNYESIIKFEYKDKYRGKLIEGPVWLGVFFYFRRQKNKKLHRFYHVNRPDLSNLLKSIEDCGNGIIYRDDRQIALSSQGKYYSNKPRIEVMFTELKEPFEDDDDDIEDDDFGWDGDYDDQPPIEWIK